MRKILSILLSLLMIISIIPMSVFSASALDSTNQITYTMQDNSNMSLKADGTPIDAEDVFFGVPSVANSITDGGEMSYADADGDGVQDYGEQIIFLESKQTNVLSSGIITKRANLSNGFTFSALSALVSYNLSSASNIPYLSFAVGDMVFKLQVGTYTTTGNKTACLFYVYKNGKVLEDYNGVSFTPYIINRADLNAAYGTPTKAPLNVATFYGGNVGISLEGETITLSLSNMDGTETTKLYEGTVNTDFYYDTYISIASYNTNGTSGIFDAELTYNAETIADKIIYDEYYKLNGTNFTLSGVKEYANTVGTSLFTGSKLSSTALSNVAVANSTMNLTGKKFRFTTQMLSWYSNNTGSGYVTTYKYDFGAFSVVVTATGNSNNTFNATINNSTGTAVATKTIVSGRFHSTAIRAAGFRAEGDAGRMNSTTYSTAQSIPAYVTVIGDGENVTVMYSTPAYSGETLVHTFDASELDLSAVTLNIGHAGGYCDREIANGYIYTEKERVSDIKAKFDEATAYDPANYTEAQYNNAVALIAEYDAMTDVDIKAYLADTVADIKSFIAMIEMLNEEISEGYTVKDLNNDMLSYKDLEVTEDVDVYNKAVEIKNTYNALEDGEVKTYLAKNFEYVNDYIIEYNNAKFIVTIEPSDKYGTYTLSAKEILVGDTVTITAEAIDNTAFVAWKDASGNILSQTAAYTIESVAPVNRLTLVFEESAHDWVVSTVEPTCYETGSMTRTCDFCGQVDGPYTLVTKEHEYESSWTVDTEATCTSIGSKSRHCVNFDKCGASTDVAVIDIVAHDMGGWSTVTPATCTEDGEKTRKCNDCDYTEDEVIASTGHSGAWKTVNGATCTEDGYKEYVCGTCDEVLDSQVIEATGHSYNEVVDAAAACDERGQKHQHCTKCGIDSDYEDILKVEHNFYDATIDDEAVLLCLDCGNKFDVHNCAECMEELEVIDAPTCTEDGLSVFACTECGYEEYTDVAATGHNYSEEWTIDAEPNCTDKGYKSHHCTNSNCDSKVDVSVIAAKGHSYSNWSNTIEPTCTEPGHAIRTCSVCWHDDETEVPATGHTAEDEWTVDVEPTCTEEGSKSHHCADCDIKLDNAPVSALGHKYVKYVNVPVSCITDGYNKQKCERCDELKYNIVEYTTALPESDHDYANDANSIYEYSVDGAEILYVTFSDACSLENGADYIEIYDINNNLIDRYTGTELASQTIEINGSKIIIKLVTDSFVRDYGFAVTKVSANMGDVLDYVEATGHNYKTTLVPATTTKDGSLLVKCENCGDERTNKLIPMASNITLSATYFVHDGDEQKPAVSVKDSNGNPINTEYYSIYVSTNGVNVGKQTIVVEFTGNYEGVHEFDYVIIPGKVTGGKATSTAYNSLKLTWTKYSGVSGYEVYRSTSKSGTYDLIYTASGASKTSYTNTGLTAGTKYYYKVRAYKSIDGVKEYGSYSSVFSGKPVPKKTTISSVKNSASKTITVKIEKQSGVSGYEFYRATSKTGTYKKVYTASGASKTTFTNTGLTKGKTYYYKVRAYKTVNGKKVYGAYSSIKYAKVSK